MRTFIPLTSAGTRTGLVRRELPEARLQTASTGMFFVCSFPNHSFTHGEVS